MSDQQSRWGPSQSFGTKTARAMEIFISHSEQDAELAKRLITLIRAAFNLPANTIRCTSVDGYRLQIGLPVQEKLRLEIEEAKVFITLLTPNSLNSHWVTFEIGGRWTTGRPLLPLLSRLHSHELQAGPLSVIQALNCESEGQLFQFISNLGDYLERQPEEPEVFRKCVLEMVELSATVTPLQGDFGSEGESYASWIDLAVPEGFVAGDRIKLTLGDPIRHSDGPAQKLLVRLLRHNEKAGKPFGVLAPEGMAVPPSRILEVKLTRDYDNVVQISVHGGETPWHYFLGKGNGSAKLLNAELISVAKNSI
jgi:TIR domain-containing protein